MNVLSTANRTSKARMGNATGSIYLASPDACAAPAATGRITDPASICHSEQSESSADPASPRFLGINA